MLFRSEQTKWMSDLLHDSSTSTVLAVVTPEEMPVVETIELRDRLQKATPIDFAGVIVNRMPVDVVDETVLSLARAAASDGDLEVSIAVADWLVARRGAAENHARRLAEAFELGNVETISEAPAETGSPAQVTEHVVRELQRILQEHG